MNSNKISADFTLSIYEELLSSVVKCGYKISTFKKFLLDNNGIKKIIILKHDVDKNPLNSLQKAKIEREFNIKSSYYFRCVPRSYNEKIISEIVELGHEIGYHYEDLAIAKGDYEIAIRNFEENLNALRALYPVETICMHGSPLSKWDNKKLWEKYNYKDFGIIADPNFDLDFNEIFYLTDTGRAWNNNSVSVRDKVISNFSFNFNSTEDIIAALKNDTMPKKIMINTHPQRWSDNYFEWYSELFMQSIKNVIKSFIIKRSS